MLPEEYKKKLEDRLYGEAERIKAEKESRLKREYEEKLEDLRREYEKAAREFVQALKG
ncbi:MAG: hypothetical protein F7C35_01810 [Desulfurococcales archaeon]|nr:hypothetical protein [Desulfurococcales archaeon]